MPATIYTLECEDALAFVWNASWGFAGLTPDGKFKWANPAYCLALGEPLDLVLGFPQTKWTHPEDLPSEENLLEQVRSGEIPGFSLRKRYIQRGSTPKRQLSVWGILSVTGKWKENEFVAFLVQFRLLEDNQDSLWQHLAHIPQWVAANQKLVWTVLLLLSTFLFGSSSTLVQLLQQVKNSEQSIERSLPPSSSSAPVP